MDSARLSDSVIRAVSEETAAVFQSKIAVVEPGCNLGTVRDRSGHTKEPHGLEEPGNAGSRGSDCDGYGRFVAAGSQDKAGFQTEAGIDLIHKRKTRTVSGSVNASDNIFVFHLGYVCRAVLILMSGWVEDVDEDGRSNAIAAKVDFCGLIKRKIFLVFIVTRSAKRGNELGEGIDELRFVNRSRGRICKMMDRCHAHENRERGIRLGGSGNRSRLLLDIYAVSILSHGVCLLKFPPEVPSGSK